MGLQITTMPSEAQILLLCTVAEMKESLRISYTKEDDLIQRCILAAYDWLSGENGWLNRSILPTTWTMTAPTFSSPMELPKPPLQSVTSVNYLVDTSPVTLPTTVYRTILNSKYGFGSIALKADQEWPTGYDSYQDAVSIVFVAGMGADAAAIRAKYFGIHKAMALLAGDYFRNREDTFTDIRMVEIDRKIVNGVQRVAGRYRFRNNPAA